jgi:hypothetical protein
LTAIRAYYRSGNDLDVVNTAIAQVQKSESIRAKIEHNVAVLRSFAQGNQRGRRLTPEPGTRSVVNLAGLDLRFTPDLVAAENGLRKYLLFNLRAADPTPEVARTILELACHVVSSSGGECSPRNFEFISIRSDRVQRITQVRRGTLNRARQSARGILQLWPAI